MQGGVRKRGKKWYYYFDLGVIDGKRKKIERVGGITKKEAEKSLRDVLNEYENRGKVVDETNLSFSGYLDFWYENYVLINCKENTKRTYSSTIKVHLKPALGDIKLKSLSSAKLQLYINNLYKQGYSKNALSSISGTLSCSLKNAVSPYNFIKQNPYTDITLPKYKNTKEEIKTISKEEFKLLCELFPKGNKYHVPIQLGYYTGMRVGEVSALTWSDIDLKYKTITVNKTITTGADGKYRIESPKTYTSNRNIDMSDKLIKILKDHKKDQLKNKIKFGEFYCSNSLGDNFVCTKENGEHLDIRKLRYINTIVQKNLNFNFNFHMLRHTHATLLLQAGVNVKYVQKRLGHSKTSTTLNTYSHFMEEFKQNELRLVENALK